MNDEYRKRLCAALHLPDDDGWEPIVKFTELIARSHGELKSENARLHDQLCILARIKRLVGEGQQGKGDGGDNGNQKQSG